jgi:hypothetical protein
VQINLFLLSNDLVVSELIIDLSLPDHLLKDTSSSNRLPDQVMKFILRSSTKLYISAVLLP